VSECCRFHVRGQVQGVFYRASTRAQARSLGITGWVRNAQDGSVEVLACGEPGAVAALEQWLQRGPPQSRVSAVRRVPSAEADPGEFTIRY